MAPPSSPCPTSSGWMWYLAGRPLAFLSSSLLPTAVAKCQLSKAKKSRSPPSRQPSLTEHRLYLRHDRLRLLGVQLYSPSTLVWWAFQVKVSPLPLEQQRPLFLPRTLLSLGDRSERILSPLFPPQVPKPRSELSPRGRSKP